MRRDSWKKLLPVLSTLLVGCSTQSLRVVSAPEGADVTVQTGDRARQKIGKTPLELSSKNTPEVFNEAFQVQVSKEGFQPQMVLVPSMGMSGGSGRVSFNLQDTELPKVCNLQEDAFNEMARGVAEVSTFVQRKKYSEATTLIQNLLSKFDRVSVLHDLQGNIFYLQKDMTRALESYRKSNALSPNNAQTLRMMGRIQQLQGLPAGGG